MSAAHSREDPRHHALRAGSEPLAALPPRARERGHPRSSEFCPRGWVVCRPAKGVIRCRGIASTPAEAGGRGADPTWIWSGSPERRGSRSEEHTYELQSLMRISYAAFCLKKKKPQDDNTK